MLPAPAPLLRIASAEAALFASDMHLDDAQPAAAARFFEHLDACLAAGLAKAERTGPPTLFLMGDLFEYWVGDDHEPAVAQALAARLAAFSGEGGRVCLMHGNRDFLMDAPIPSRPGLQSYSSRCGATLLPDPVVIDVAGRRIGLSHGDSLCTGDTRYQEWRELCRSSAWQQQFLALPVTERLAMAHAMRKQSIAAQAVTETLSDVDQAAVDALMSQLAARLLVHGHTHQPMLHRWTAPSAGGAKAGAAAGERLRWVLSDWAVSPPRGEVLPLSAVTGTR